MSETKLLTAMTKPMVSDRVAQKMSDMQKNAKHPCIWETGRRKARENYETTKHLSPKHATQLFKHHDRTFCSPDTKEKKESFTFNDFPAVPVVSTTSLTVCGMDVTRTHPPFMWSQPKPSAVSWRQQPPPAHNTSRSRTDMASSNFFFVSLGDMRLN